MSQGVSAKLEGMTAALPRLDVLTRTGCGSCVRVHAQVCAIAADYGLTVHMRDVDTDPDPEYAQEFGDRVPVVLINDEEHACWEIDEADLRQALQAAGALRMAGE